MYPRKWQQITLCFLQVGQKICVLVDNSYISVIQRCHKAQVAVLLSDEVQAVADQGTSSEFSDDASSSHKVPFIDEDYMLTVFERYAN